MSYIQQLLGHESISTTSGFYAFATLKTLAYAIEKANPSRMEEKKWKDESVLKQFISCKNYSDIFSVIPSVS